MLQGGEEARGPLTPNELARLRSSIEAFVMDPAPDATLNLGASMLFIKAGFDILKAMVRQGGTLGAAANAKVGAVGGDVAGLQEQLHKLKVQVSHSRYVAFTHTIAVP